MGAEEESSRTCGVPFEVFNSSGGYEAFARTGAAMHPEHTRGILCVLHRSEPIQELLVCEQPGACVLMPYAEDIVISSLS